jgi:hypothetical protein
MTRIHGADMETLSDPAVKTYSYLRLGVVGMAFALAVSVIYEIATGESTGVLGSISAYYYTPVRAIFVGVLVAVGLALIAIKGREGPEDVMLNLAGMLAPLVALVPTPISDTVYGLNPDKRAIPDELVPSVENNVWAILVLAGGGLVVGHATLPGRGSRERRPMLIGLWAGAILWLLFTAWFLFGRPSFLELGHYLAAIPMFMLLAGVAIISARNAASRRQSSVRGLKPAQYRRVYYAIAVAMYSLIVVAITMFGLQALTDAEMPSAWLFVVESLLLLLFIAFWLAQTAENWKLGSPVVDQPAAHAPTSEDPVAPRDAD